MTTILQLSRFNETFPNPDPEYISFDANAGRWVAHNPKNSIIGQLQLSGRVDERNLRWEGWCAAVRQTN